MSHSEPILLYDGSCGFCTESVQTVLRHDRRGRIRFAPLQGEFGAALLARHQELRSVDSMIVVEQAAGGAERIAIKSAAALRIAAYLGGIWRVLLLGHVVPGVIRDGLYDFIARHRHQIMGPPQNCLVVTPELKSRFLP
jgi:predicted DCC family thiol-disulfide oxidoreductase YuxK